MKIMFTAIILLFGTHAFAAQASARFFCMSLKFGLGSDTYGFASMEFSSVNATVNGELAPLDQEYGWMSGLIQNDLITDDIYYGQIRLSVPSEDINGDGFPDFFDTSLASSGTTSGEISFPYYGPYSITARWSRAAGSRFGSCVWQSPLGTFSHTVEVLEYRGQLSYTKGTNVQASITLSKSGDPAATFSGSCTFQPDSVTPQDSFWLTPGTWTNQVAEAFTLYGTYIDRDLNLKTNYYGVVELKDGDLSTPEDDYYYWMLSIDDTHDSDADGVPDFSDISGPALPATLNLMATAQDLNLFISGPQGTTWQVQSAPTPIGPWTDGSTVTLSSGNQSIPLTKPLTTTFWRLIAR